VEQVSDMSSSFDWTFCLRDLAIVHAGGGGHNRDSSTAAGSGGHNHDCSTAAGSGGHNKIECVKTVLSNIIYSTVCW
jgi:hypothetical protein